MIRIPDLPGLQPTSINAPLASAAAANAPNEALGQLAQSIAGVGEYFQTVADDVQKAENVRLESETRQKWDADFQKLQLELAKEPNQDTHLEKVNGFLTQMNGSWDRPGVAPAVKQRLALDFDEFAHRAKLGTAENVARKAMTRAQDAMKNEVGEANRTLDRGRLMKSLGTAKANFGLTPEEEASQIAHFERNLAIKEAGTLAELDPLTALETFQKDKFIQDSKGLNFSDRDRLVSEAERNIQKQRTEDLDTLEMAMDANMLTPADLEASSYITDNDRKRFRSALENFKPPTSEEHGKVWDLLLANRQTFADQSISDKEYASRWNDLRTEVISMVPKNFRGDINAEIQYRSPANRRTVKNNPPGYSDKQELKAVGLARITRARSANLFGPVGDDADPVKKEAAFRRSEELRLDVARFIDQTPDVTIEQVTEFADSRISGDRVKTSARELQSFVPGSAQRLRPGPFMPPLPPRSGIKDKATDDSLQIAPGQGEASDALLPPLQQLENFLK